MDNLLINDSCSLKGQIERIIYSNDETGYIVAKIKVYGQNTLETIAGNIITPRPGEIISMTGQWIIHPKFGRQFKVSSFKTEVPATVFGIQKYLGSGLIKNIGPRMAKKIVKKFGEKTLEIIENDWEKLSEVDGVGKKRSKLIKAAWDDQKEIRDVMLFLQSNGISSAYAVKIYKEYANDSIKIVTENPYRLATDIFGIGFIIADKIARNLGFDKNSILRAEAGILYVLNKLADDGHVYYPYKELTIKCNEILEVDYDIIISAFSKIIQERKIVIEDLNEDIDDYQENNKAVYLAKFYVCETGIARKLKILNNTRKININVEKAINQVENFLSIKLAQKQKTAIKCSLESKVLVITGGPGTGKTTIINAILKIFISLEYKVLLAAPTGRAAKRMSETTGYTSKTIHRLLEYSIKIGGFQKNEKKNLVCDLLIIDEASMIDTVLMYHLLKAVPENATLILIGDIYQLPSVGAGNVLKDIIESKRFPVVELNEIFRQSQQSQIIVNSHKINMGMVPDDKLSYPESDYYFIQKDEPTDVLKIIIELVTKRIPNRFNYNSLEDIQVLSPMNKGILGSLNLNIELQQALNPKQDGINRGHKSFRINDKVMQIRNNYEKEVFNGDIGKIMNIDTKDQVVSINFDGKIVNYNYADLDEVVLAYAVSIHKAQGSEYPVVIVPLVMQHYILLQRNLIYTGVTRGRKLVVIVGSKKAFTIGVKNNKTEKRYTFLKNRLND